MSSMTIGELTGYVGLDVDELSKNAKKGQRDVDGMAKAILDAAELVEKGKFTAKLDADAAALEQKVFDAEELLAYIGKYKSTPKIDADIAAAEGKVTAITADLERLRGLDVTPEVKAEISAAERDLARVQAELSGLNGQKATLDVDAETDRVRYELVQLESQLASVNTQRIRIRMDVDNSGAMQKAAQDAAQLASRAMSAGAAVLAIGAAVPAIGALGAALTAAAGAAALLPALLGAAAAGIGALMVGFSGVGDALGELGKRDAAGGAGASAAGAQRAAAAQAVESAVRSLADAQDQANRQAIQGAQQIADSQRAVEDAIKRADQVAADGARQVASARQAVTDALESAARRVESAEAAVERSQASATDAQEALNRAREKAKDRIEDMALALSGAALDEESANLRLLKAQDALKRAGSNKNSLGYKEAELAVRQAEQAVKESKKSYTDLKDEAVDAAAKGVEGSDEVVAAQKRLDQANAQVASSKKALQQAEIDGDKAVAQARARLTETEESAARASEQAAADVGRAKEQLARTEQQVGWARADALKRVEDAERALDQARQQAAAGAGGAAGGVDKYAAALAKLSPAARAVVKELERLKPQWEALQRSVQEKLFTGVAEEIRALAGIYLPMLEQTLGTVATGFNTAFKGISQFLQSEPVVKALRVAWDNVATATSTFAQALVPIFQIFTDLFTVGSSFLPGMANGFLDSANAAAAFVHEAAESGKLKEWIQQGLDVLGDLWQILKNVGGIIGAVFGAGNDGGKTFLQTLVDLTGQLRAFLEAPAVQTALAGLFQFLADHGPMLATLALGMWGVSKAITGVAGGIKLVNTVGDIGKTFGLWGGASDTAAGKVAKFAIDGIASVGKFAGNLAMQAIRMAASWLVAMGPIGWIILAVAGLVALIIIYWDEIVAFTTTAWAAVWGAIQAAWDWIVGIVTAAAQGVVDWLVGAWQWIVDGATAAWSAVGDALQAAWDWIVNLVSTAAQGVVDWLANAWENVRSGVVGAWDAVTQALADAWEWIKTKVGEGVDWVLSKIAWFGELGAKVGAWFLSVKDAAVAKLGELLSWVTGLPGRILSGLGNLGTLLWNAGSDIISGLWNGIKSMGSWLASNVMNFVRQYVPGPVLDFLGIASPSRLFRDEIGKWIPRGLAAGIDANASMAGDAARAMAQEAIDGAKGLVSASDFAEIEAYANSQAAAATAGRTPFSGPATGQIPTGQPGDPARAGSTININNPLPETSSESLNRRARTLEKLGVLGG